MRKYVNIRQCFLGLYILMLSIVPFATFSQDIHYSQFFNSMLFLNPSLSGNFDGNIRGIINHRNQWNSVSVPFVTSSLSFDSRLFENKAPDDIFGAGLFVSSDKSGPGNLSVLSILPSFSFSKIFGKNHTQTIGLGIQTGFVQKKIDFSMLTFASQFYGEDFDTGIPSGENTDNYKATYFDLGAGINYRKITSKKMIFNTGLSLYHLSKPQESFISDFYKLPMRGAFYGSLVIPAGKSADITAMLLVMKQNKATEKTLFAKIGKTSNMNNEKTVKLNFGAGLRLSDAFILYTGLQYNNIEAGISYDINFSTLHPASNYRGGFEVSIIYTDRLFSGRNRLPKKVPCLRM